MQISLAPAANHVGIRSTPPGPKPKSEIGKTSQFQKRINQAAEDADAKKWDGVPTWKRQLLQAKAAKDAKLNAPALAKAAVEAEREANFAAMPAWKQALVHKKRA